MNLTEPDVEFFMNLDHKVWFVSWKVRRLIKDLDITVVPRERENKACAKVANSVLDLEAFYLF